jgi:hypothetical protein
MRVLPNFWVRCIRGMLNFFWEGTPISVFIAFLLTSFVKFWREGPLLYPLPPASPCMHLWTRLLLETTMKDNKKL